MEIKSTKDYSMFKTITGNRDIAERHVTKLIGSISKNNLLQYNPIIVNEKMEVIDGQHRLEVARKNNFDIYYVVVDGADLSDVQILNANNKTWSMQDYLDSFIMRGNKDYLILKQFCAKYPMPITLAIKLLDDSSIKKNESKVQRFKDGKFKVTTPEFAEVIAKNLEKLLPYVSRPQMIRQESFATALIQAYTKVTPEYLLKRINAYTSLPLREAKVINDYLRQFEDVLNFNLKRKPPVRLF